MHETFVSQLAPAEGLPCADDAFLEPLKQTAEFTAIRDRLVGAAPIDSWLEDELHFFVFELRPEENAGREPGLEPQVAVFVMHRDSNDPVSAVIVTSLPGGDDAEIRDLKEPDSTYVAPVA